MTVGPSRTVILSFMGIGDMLMALRAISYYSYGVNDIVWICKSDSSDIIKSCFPHAPIEVIDKRKADSPLRSIVYLIWLIPHLATVMRRRRCDRAVVLDYKWKPVLLFGLACRLARIKEIIGCVETQALLRLFSQPFKMHQFGDVHEVDRYRRMFTAGQFRERGHQQPPSPHSLSGLRPRDPAPVSKPGVRRQLVLVAPGSYRAFKRWDYLNYCEIIQRLDKVDVRVALIGGKEDAELAKRILMKVGRESVENLCGMVGFVELASLMEHAALLLTNDSAAMHLADLVGLKVIALFGITRPERCGPYSQTGNAIRSRNSESGSYSFGKFSKYDDTCINSIDIEEVWVAVASRIGIRI